MGTHKWQNPLMNFALYIISAAISIRRILYMVVKKYNSSSLLVFTEVDGGSILCVLYGLTCKACFPLDIVCGLAVNIAPSSLQHVVSSHLGHRSRR